MASGLVSMLVIVAAGCAAEDPAFDPAIISMAVQAEVDPIGIEEVVCDDPTPVDQEPAGTVPWWELGAELGCRGSLNSDDVDLLVTVAPPVDGDIAVAVDVLTPLFDVSVAESAAAARLDAELGGAPEIDCGERLVVVSPGRRIECRVTAAGGTAGPVDQPLAIVILDDDADWEIDLIP